MRQGLWIMSICNKRDEVGVFVLTGMNCQVLSLETHVVVVWVTQTDTMRRSVTLTHEGFIQKIKPNHMLVIKMKSWKNGSQMWHSDKHLNNWVISVFVSVSQLTNVATYIASPRRLATWSSRTEWSWTAHAAHTRTHTVCVCVGSVR